jgi:hypothetical protein
VGSRLSETAENFPFETRDAKYLEENACVAGLTQTREIRT